MRKGLRKKKKLPWQRMGITRVKLNPEQAVLSCCTSGGYWTGGVCAQWGPGGYSEPSSGGASS